MVFSNSLPINITSPVADAFKPLTTDATREDILRNTFPTL